MNGAVRTEDLPVIGRMCRTKPDYSLAGVLAEQIRKFFENPENEKEYQEWLKAREGKGQ